MQPRIYWIVACAAVIFVGCNAAAVNEVSAIPTKSLTEIDKCAFIYTYIYICITHAHCTPPLSTDCSSATPCIVSCQRKKKKKNSTPSFVLIRKRKSKQEYCPRHFDIFQKEKMFNHIFSKYKKFLNTYTYTYICLCVYLNFKCTYIYLYIYVYITLYLPLTFEMSE